MRQDASAPGAEPPVTKGILCSAISIALAVIPWFLPRYFQDGLGFVFPIVAIILYPPLLIFAAVLGVSGLYRRERPLVFPIVASVVGVGQLLLLVNALVFHITLDSVLNSIARLRHPKEEELFSLVREFPVDESRSKRITWLVRSGIDVDYSPRHGWPALFSLVNIGEIDLVRHVLAGGANPNATLSDGTTPLMFAISRNYLLRPEQRRELVNLLLESGAQVNAQDSQKETPLLKAVRTKDYDLVKTLLDAGADPRLGIWDEKVPLNAARDAPEIRRLLIDYGADGPRPTPDI